MPRPQSPLNHIAETDPSASDNDELRGIVKKVVETTARDLGLRAG